MILLSYDVSGNMKDVVIFDKLNIFLDILCICHEWESSIRRVLTEIVPNYISLCKWKSVITDFKILTLHFILIVFVVENFQKIQNVITIDNEILLILN